MKRTAIIAASVLLALGATACAPITSYNGFQAQDVKPEQLVVLALSVALALLH